MGETLKLTFRFGDIAYTYDLSFLISVALAAFVVFVFALSKFGESTIEKTDDDFITQLLPKYLTTPEEYSRALIFYVTVMVALVVILSFLGPRVVSLGAVNVPDAPNALPFLIALVLIGLMPNVPWLQELERHLRRFAHERAFIPRAARATAGRLASTEFDFSAYKTDQVLASAAMRGVEASDFEAARDTIEYSWARLGCLLYQLRRLQDSGLAADLDGEVLQHYAASVQNLSLKRRALEDEIAEYRQKKASGARYGDDDLHASIAQLLQQLYVLIGCSVRLKLSTDTEMNPALRPFGFVSILGKTEYGNRGVAIIATCAAMASIFVTVYVAIGVHFVLSSAGLWQASDQFPQAAFEPFKWALSGLLAQGAAILVAEMIRSRRIGKKRWWLIQGEQKRRNPVNYVFVAMAAGAAGFCMLYLWSLIFTMPSLFLAKLASPHALLPAATGAFYVFHLDNLELRERPSRFKEIAIQAVTTGFCGFAAASASRAIAGMPQVVDVLLFNTVIGVAIGASLAWYVPSAAAPAESPSTPSEVKPPVGAQPLGTVAN